MKHDPLKVKTIEEMKTKELYKENYEKIMKAMNSNTKITWAYLLDQTGLSSDTLSRYLAVLRKLGAVEKEYLAPSKKYMLEPLKLRERDIIINTDFEHAFFRPPKYLFNYYNPSIPTNYIKYNVKDFDRKIERIEEHLLKADDEWILILTEARNNYVRELWNNAILLDKEIYALAKFSFCLYVISQIHEYSLWRNPKRSANEHWDIFIEIQERAFNRYIKKRYPGITPSQMNTLDINNERENKQKDVFFRKIEDEIEIYYDPTLLEHMIVIDRLGMSSYRSEELEKAGIAEAFSIDRDKPIGEQLKKKKISEEKPMYDAETVKYLVHKWSGTPVDEKLYVKTPFFKDFLQGYEKDLKRLGFKTEKNDIGLKTFYKNLDRTAETIRIPSLPDNLSVLI